MDKAYGTPQLRSKAFFGIHTLKIWLYWEDLDGYEWFGCVDALDREHWCNLWWQQMDSCEAITENLVGFYQLEVALVGMCLPQGW